MKTSTAVRFVLLALLLATIAPYTGAQGSRYSLTIKNETDWDIHHLYVSSSDEEKWGPDQLGKQTIGSGESFTLTGISVGEYDIKFVDEDGDACILHKVVISKNTTWTLTSEWLLKCQRRSQGACAADPASFRADAQAAR